MARHNNRSDPGFDQNSPEVEEAIEAVLSVYIDRLTAGEILDETP